MTDPGHRTALSVRPDFETTVERLRTHARADDRSRWGAGDAVVAYLGQAVGNSDDVAETLNRLAAHSGFHRAGLRERYHCSLFWWPQSTRRWDTVSTWSAYNRARRVGDFETACDWMERAENSAWSVAELEWHLQAERAGEPRPPPAVILPTWRADSPTVASWMAENPEGHVLLLPGKEEWAGKTVRVRVKG